MGWAGECWGLTSVASRRSKDSPDKPGMVRKVRDMDKVTISLSDGKSITISRTRISGGAYEVMAQNRMGEILPIEGAICNTNVAMADKIIEVATDFIRNSMLVPAR